jgi:hypothetical protein
MKMLISYQITFYVWYVWCNLLLFVGGSAVVKLSNIAVFVIGEHRIYDATWPSHEKYLYQPIRESKETHRLDIFVCQKKGDQLPTNMPKPLAEFYVGSTYDQVTHHF